MVDYGRYNVPIYQVYDRFWYRTGTSTVVERDARMLALALVCARTRPFAAVLSSYMYCVDGAFVARLRALPELPSLLTLPALPAPPSLPPLPLPTLLALPALLALPPLPTLPTLLPLWCCSAHKRYGNIWAFPRVPGVWGRVCFHRSLSCSRVRCLGPPSPRGRRGGRLVGR